MSASYVAEKSGREVLERYTMTGKEWADCDNVLNQWRGEFCSIEKCHRSNSTRFPVSKKENGDSLNTHEIVSATNFSVDQGHVVL